MPELARQRADGVIDRSKTRDTPHSPVALYEVAHLFGTLVAETILASVHVRARKQAGHMDASDLIRALQNALRRGGCPHMGSGGKGACGRGGWNRTEIHRLSEMNCTVAFSADSDEEVLEVAVQHAVQVP